MDYTITQIPLEKICVAPGRMRTDYGDIAALADSIHQRGLLQPIIVMYLKETDEYQIVAGERRFKAMQLLNFSSAPAYVRPFTNLLLDAADIELIENLHRKQFTWQEEVKAKQLVHNMKLAQYGRRLPGEQDPNKGWTIQKTAELFSESATKITQDLKVAQALEVLPEIGEKASSANEAFKLLKAQAAAQATKEIADRMKKRIMQAEEMMRKEQKATLEATSETDKKLVEFASNINKVIASYEIVDAIEHLRSMPSESIDLLEVDWPYGIDLNHILVFADIQDKVDLEQVDNFTHLASAVIAEGYRVLKPNGWMLCWYAMLPWHDYLLQRLIAQDFIVSPPAMWVKNTGNCRMPEYNLKNHYEPFMYARKGKPSIAKVRGNVFACPASQGGNKVHPTEKPIELMQEILSTFCYPNFKIHVPFAGSGNTLLAAANLSLEATGTDINKNYKDHFVVKAMGMQPYKSFKENLDA